MKKPKFDKKITHRIIATLDRLAKKVGLAETRHGANKWVQSQQAKASYERKRRMLEEQLATVNRRLRA